MVYESAIHAADATFLSAVNAHHPSAIADCFVSDAKIMPAYSRTICGREAIASFWHGMFTLESMGLAHKSLEIQVYLDWAYETGIYQFLGQDRRILDEGSYLVIWRCIDQRWKRYREIWNSSPLEENANDLAVV